jgi:hypothetical protein
VTYSLPARELQKGLWGNLNRLFMPDSVLRACQIAQSGRGLGNGNCKRFSELLLTFKGVLGSVGVRPIQLSPQKKIMFFRFLVYDLVMSSLPEMAVS